MRWSIEERAFAVEAYFSNRQSVVANQRAFQNRFKIAPRGPTNWEYDTTKNW
ncbi:Transposable element Tc3 transposase, partial [Caligus rogercresseyi]